MSNPSNEKAIQISALHYYPVKSCAAVNASEVTLDAQGILFDRRWMIVRAEDGRFLTQREYPSMACILPEARHEGLTLNAPGLTPLHLPTLPDVGLMRRNVTVWSFTGEALDEGSEAAAWISDAIGTACRLVRTPEDFTRRVSPTHTKPDDRVGFADGYPLLLTNTASLNDLNGRMSVVLPMERFRPNVVIRGAEAWAEDAWREMHVADSAVTFRVAKPCARCAITTVNQATGEKSGPEPLATLAKFRRDADGKVMFGMNLVHDQYGDTVRLRVGDTVTVR
jgi:uncharacterized protein